MSESLNQDCKAGESAEKYLSQRHDKMAGVGFKPQKEYRSHLLSFYLVRFFVSVL